MEFYCHQHAQHAHQCALHVQQMINALNVYPIIIYTKDNVCLIALLVIMKICSLVFAFLASITVQLVKDIIQWELLFVLHVYKNIFLIQIIHVKFVETIANFVNQIAFVLNVVLDFSII